jgi:hypothetical protein
LLVLLLLLFLLLVLPLLLLFLLHLLLLCCAAILPPWLDQQLEVRPACGRVPVGADELHNVLIHQAATLLGVSIPLQHLVGRGIEAVRVMVRCCASILAKWLSLLTIGQLQHYCCATAGHY